MVVQAQPGANGNKSTGPTAIAGQHRQCPQVIALMSIQSLDGSLLLRLQYMKNHYKACLQALLPGLTMQTLSIKRLCTVQSAHAVVGVADKPVCFGLYRIRQPVSPIIWTAAMALLLMLSVPCSATNIYVLQERECKRDCGIHPHTL